MNGSSYEETIKKMVENKIKKSSNQYVWADNNYSYYMRKCFQLIFDKSFHFLPNKQKSVFECDIFYGRLCNFFPGKCSPLQGCYQCNLVIAREQFHTIF